jgi:hypothetical protein
MATWVVTDNTLADTLDAIEMGAGRVLEGCGMLFKERAVRDCPVSDIDEPGYVHLYETIGYEVSLATTYFQQWVTFFVLKHYAIFVNNGTSRMRPRPFFTNGLLAVERGVDDLIHRIFFDLMMGRPPRKL